MSSIVMEKKFSKCPPMTGHERVYSETYREKGDSRTQMINISLPMVILYIMILIRLFFWPNGRETQRI